MTTSQKQSLTVILAALVLLLGCWLLQPYTMALSTKATDSEGRFNLNHVTDLEGSTFVDIDGKAWKLIWEEVKP